MRKHLACTLLWAAILGVVACAPVLAQTTRVTGPVDTELPTPAAMSDSMSNPTAPAVAAHLAAWDSGSGTWKRVKFGPAGTSGDPLFFSMINGSLAVTEAATITANQANIAQVLSVLFGYDGTTDSRIRARGGLIGSADMGIVVRPFLPSDGTNTQPAMDAAARAGFQRVSDGTNVWSEPCTFLPHTTVPFSTTVNLKLISQASSKKNYICGLVAILQGADTINIIEGTGSACATGAVALVGSTTAANGLSFLANGGFVVPIKLTGIGTNVDSCLWLASGSRVAGFIDYVQQ